MVAGFVLFWRDQLKMKRVPTRSVPAAVVHVSRGGVVRLYRSDE